MCLCFQSFRAERHKKLAKDPVEPQCRSLNFTSPFRAYCHYPGINWLPAALTAANRAALSASYRIHDVYAANKKMIAGH